MIEYALIKISSDGNIEVIKRSSSSVSLGYLRSLVGGWVELVNIRFSVHDLVMACDSEGHLLFKPVNAFATRLYGNPHHCIVGDVVIGLPVDMALDGISEPDFYAMPLLLAEMLCNAFSRLP